MGKRFVIIDPINKKEGLRFYDTQCPTLNARDYKEPKIVLEYEQVHNIIQSGHNPDNQNGGGEFFN